MAQNPYYTPAQRAFPEIAKTYLSRAAAKLSKTTKSCQDHPAENFFGTMYNYPPFSDKEHQSMCMCPIVPERS